MPTPRNPAAAHDDSRKRRLVDLLTELVDLLTPPAPIAAQSQWLTVEIITSEFGVAPKAIAALRRRGALTPRKLGRTVLFARADVERVIATSTTDRRASSTGDTVARALAAAGLQPAAVDNDCDAPKRKAGAR